MFQDVALSLALRKKAEGQTSLHTHADHVSLMSNVGFHCDVCIDLSTNLPRQVLALLWLRLTMYLLPKEIEDIRDALYPHQHDESLEEERGWDKVSGVGCLSSLAGFGGIGIGIASPFVCVEPWSTTLYLRISANKIHTSNPHVDPVGWLRHRKSIDFAAVDRLLKKPADNHHMVACHMNVGQ